MADDRAKFIKELQKAIKTSSSAVERLESRKLLAKLMLGVGGTAGDVSIDADGNAVVTPQPPTPVVYEQYPSQYDFAIQQMSGQAGTSLVTLMLLLHVPSWMKGVWSDTPSGWHDHRTGKSLTFVEAGVLIAARIKELNLNSEFVYAYPKSKTGSIHEYMAFIRSPFEEQMERFKA